MLTSTFPPALVDEVLKASGRMEQRHRLLLARVVVYFTLAMCLWADEGYDEVARLLVGGLERMARWRGSWRVPTTGAITQARARLGAGAMKMLFERVVSPTSAQGSVGSWWRGLRLVAIDGTVFDLPDTASNEAHFGQPGSGRGEMNRHVFIRTDETSNPCWQTAGSRQLCADYMFENNKLLKYAGGGTDFTWTPITDVVPTMDGYTYTWDVDLADLGQPTLQSWVFNGNG